MRILSLAYGARPRGGYVPKRAVLLLQGLFVVLVPGLIAKSLRAGASTPLLIVLAVVAVSELAFLVWLVWKRMMQPGRDAATATEVNEQHEAGW